MLFNNAAKGRLMSGFDAEFIEASSRDLAKREIEDFELDLFNAKIRSIQLANLKKKDNKQ
jgi:hypothetical protein